MQSDLFYLVYVCVWTMVVVVVDIIMHDNYLKCLFCCLVKS
jgi:hypothetical protein